MSAWLPLSAIVVSALAGALRNDISARYWLVAIFVSLALTVAQALSIQDPGPPGNSPTALAIAFIFFPSMVTSLVERVVLRRPGSLAAFLALPLGLASFAGGVVAAMIVTVNAGILSP